MKRKERTFRRERFHTTDRCRLNSLSCRWFRMSVTVGWTSVSLTMCREKTRTHLFYPSMKISYALCTDSRKCNVWIVDELCDEMRNGWKRCELTVTTAFNTMETKFIFKRTVVGDIYYHFVFLDICECSIKSVKKLFHKVYVQINWWNSSEMKHWNCWLWNATSDEIGRFSNIKLIRISFLLQQI